MHRKRIYVAATSQHVGKTTSTLGLVSVLADHGLNVGYCKPVGQQYIELGPSRADKDALLFAKTMNFELVPQLHSPVILGPGATTAYLDNPDSYAYTNRVKKASKILAQKHDVVVYEGTGHPGVGSVVGLSNSRVAELLGCGVIMIVEAGIGNTLDKLYLNLAPFRHAKVPIIGVIVNKAKPDKIEKIKHYVGNSLKAEGIKLLGILPYEAELGLPVLHTIKNAIRAEVIHNEDCLDNRVRNIIAGSLIDMNELKNFTNQLLVVSINRFDDAMRKLEKVTRFIEADEYPLSGILLTGKGELKEEHISDIQKHRIPVLLTKLDTYESVMKISRIEVKINIRTPWKVKKAVQLFKEHVDLESILKVFVRK